MALVLQNTRVFLHLQPHQSKLPCFGLVRVLFQLDQLGAAMHPEGILQADHVMGFGVRVWKGLGLEALKYKEFRKGSGFKYYFGKF